MREQPDLSIGEMKTRTAALDVGGFSFAVGEVIGHYEVLNPLGRGGMGEVYHVRHTTLELEYALKLLPRDFTRQSGALVRFKDEAKVMARLNHPNIVKVDEFGDIDERYWLRMELMSGLPDGSISLADLASANGGKLEQLLLARIIEQALSGLQCAHEHGVIHRDLKPGNILLTGTQENITVKIADFGLVKLAGDEWLRSMVEKSLSANRSIGDLATEAVTVQGTSTNALLGTYAYMSPEQQRGEDIDTRSDLYSMGLIIFRLLTGETVLGMKPPSRLVDGLLPDWDDLLYNALETNRDARIASAAEMLDAITGILDKLKQQESERRAEAERQRKLDAEKREAEERQRLAAEAEKRRLEAERQRKLMEQRQAEAERQRMAEERRQAEQARSSLATQTTKPQGADQPEQSATADNQRKSPAKRKIVWIVAIIVIVILGIIALSVHQNNIEKRRKDEEKRRIEAQRQAEVERQCQAELMGMKFVYVAPGSFQMGSNDGGSAEKPVHRVTISRGYWIGKYEVTQDEYQSIMGSNPSRFKGGNNPVEMVSWNDAVKFCEKLTERERAAGRLPSGYEYRLPTEAEWEYAARGGNKSRGYKYSGSDSIDNVAWYSSNSRNKTHEVGTKSGNELGIHDMSGNVWEWCNDRYGNYPGGSTTDPTGASLGSSRVYRGGSWANYSGNCRSAFRTSALSGGTNFSIGFRVAFAPVH